MTQWMIIPFSHTQCAPNLQLYRNFLSLYRNGTATTWAIPTGSLNTSHMVLTVSYH